jgi:hypothetical protein
MQTRLFPREQKYTNLGTLYTIVYYVHLKTVPLNLKFIKSKPSKDLAKQAIEQITMVQEERHVRKTEVRDEED